MIRSLLMCGALALAVPAIASAQDTAPAADPSMAASMSPSDYVTAAGQSDQFEIQEGQLAQQKGQSAAVKKFGAKMISDHTKSTQMVMAAAQKSGMPAMPPPPLRPDQQQMVEQLQGMSGADFDRTYISQQMQSHQQALALQQAYAQNGGDRNLKAAAAKIVPVVEMHISMLQQMAPGGSMSSGM